MLEQLQLQIAALAFVVIVFATIAIVSIPLAMRARREARELRDRLVSNLVAENKQLKADNSRLIYISVDEHDHSDRLRAERDIAERNLNEVTHALENAQERIDELEILLDRSRRGE